MSIRQRGINQLRHQFYVRLKEVLRSKAITFAADRPRNFAGSGTLSYARASAPVVNHRKVCVSRDRAEITRMVRQFTIIHLPAQPFELRLQLRHEHRAFRDVAHPMRVGFEITQTFSDRIVLPLRARAIMPLVGSRRDVEIRNVVDAPDAAQAVANDFGFRVKLRLIIQLLEVAAATAAKIWAGRLDALRRRLKDFNNRSERDISLYPIDAYSQTIAGR